MIHIQTGRRVSIYLLAALGRVARGQMTIEQALAVVEKREHERELEQIRRAKKKSA